MTNRIDWTKHFEQLTLPSWWNDTHQHRQAAPLRKMKGKK